MIKRLRKKKGVIKIQHKEEVPAVFKFTDTELMDKCKRDKSYFTKLYMENMKDNGFHNSILRCLSRSSIDMMLQRNSIQNSIDLDDELIFNPLQTMGKLPFSIDIYRSLSRNREVDKWDGYAKDLPLSYKIMTMHFHKDMSRILNSKMEELLERVFCNAIKNPINGSEYDCEYVNKRIIKEFIVNKFSEPTIISNRCDEGSKELLCHYLYTTVKPTIKKVLEKYSGSNITRVGFYKHMYLEKKAIQEIARLVFTFNRVIFEDIRKDLYSVREVRRVTNTEINQSFRSKKYNKEILLEFLLFNYNNRKSKYKIDFQEVKVS